MRYVLRRALVAGLAGSYLLGKFRPTSFHFIRADRECSLQDACLLHQYKTFLVNLWMMNVECIDGQFFKVKDLNPICPNMDKE